MSVFQEKNGTWTCHIRVSDYVTGKKVDRKKRGFKYKREALAWQAQEIASNKASTSSITFSDMLDRYEKFSQCSKSMNKKRKQVLSKRFSNFMDIPIQKITKRDLVEWRSELSDLPLATRTKNTTLQYVRSVFRYANQFYDIPDMIVPLTPFKMTDREVLKEMQIWTPEEFNVFLQAVPENRKIYRIFFDFLFWTGMSKGEAIAIHKSDINSNMVTVKYSYRNSVEGLKPTKTRQTRRVKIDSALLAEITPLLSAPGPFLFGGETPLSPTTIGRVFNEAIATSGVRPIRIHDLRHSHASWLIGSGANIVAVSKRLGHASIEQTLKTYTHLLEKSDDELLSLISSERQVDH